MRSKQTVFKQTQATAGVNERGIECCSGRNNECELTAEPNSQRKKGKHKSYTSLNGRRDTATGSPM